METNEDEESERDVESDERKDDGLLLLKRECVREREKLIWFFKRKKKNKCT